jgi:DNA mismatch endonuclease (patch repair protein)
MSRIRGKNTKPELKVRRALHAMGFRFRLHRRDLPGTPDILLPRYRIAIQVHGCYWHRHPGCHLTTTPKTNAQFWQQKFDRNVERDAKNEAALVAMGWQVMVIWECETRDAERLRQTLVRDLPPRA